MAIIAYAGINSTYSTIAGSPAVSASASEGTYVSFALGTSALASGAVTVNTTPSSEFFITFRINVTANSVAAGGYRTVAFVDDNTTLFATGYGSTVFKLRFYQNGNVTVLFNGVESSVLSTWDLNAYTLWGLNIKTNSYSLYKDGVLQGTVSASIGTISPTRFVLGHLGVSGDSSGSGSLTVRTNTIAAVNVKGGSRTTWFDYDNDIPVIIMPLWSLAESIDTATSTSAIRSSLMGPPFSGGIYARSQTPNANLKFSSYYAAYCAEGFETIVLAAGAGGLENLSSGNIYFGHQSHGSISYNATGKSVSVTIPYLKEPSVNRNVGETIYASYTLASASTFFLTMGGVGFYKERPVVQSKLWLVDDNAASTDRYLAAFFSEGAALTKSGLISNVQLKVTKASDGSTLFGPSAMTAIDTGLYKLDVTGAGRIADGAGYVATLTAVVGGRNFTWYQPVGRDSF